MKKRIFILLTSFLFLKATFAGFGDDLKTLGLASLYGSIGGTLVGVAVMAIGGNGQSVVKGASVGLVAGAGIGGYFLVSEKVKPLRGEVLPANEASYDNGAINDYDDIYYGKRWEVPTGWEKRFPRQLNNIKAKDDISIYFSLFQKNF